MHFSCQGQTLGRVLATALPDESLDEELEEISPPLRTPARSDSRMARVVRRIGATLPSLLVPTASPPQRRPHVPDRRAAVDWRWTTAMAGSVATATITFG